MNKVPRKPNAAELALLAKEVADLGGMGGYTLDEAAELLAAAWVAVFDDYMPDGPGYCGKVALVIWSGGVDLVETFVFRTAADSSRPLEAEYAARAA